MCFAPNIAMNSCCRVNLHGFNGEDTRRRWRKKGGRRGGRGLGGIRDNVKAWNINPLAQHPSLAVCEILVDNTCIHQGADRTLPDDKCALTRSLAYSYTHNRIYKMKIPTLISVMQTGKCCRIQRHVWQLIHTHRLRHIPAFCLWS